MKSMIEKVFSIKALVALIIICATTSAWADTTTLKTTVSVGSFTVNNVNAAAFDHCTQTVAASPTLTIPASTDLPAGTKVAITTISLGKRQSTPGNTVVPDKIRITVGTTDYTSASKTEDTDAFVSEANNNNTALKQKYSFDGTGCILEVGEPYNIKLLNSSGAEISGNGVLNVRVVKNSQSLFGDTIYADISGNRWTPVQEIAGDIIYTCTVASNGSTSWDITPTTPATSRLWFEVAESASLAIGNLSCKTAYFNVADGKMLSLSGTVTASDGIYILGDGVNDGVVRSSAAGTLVGTVKGSGTLQYYGSGTDVQPTIGASGIVLTNSAWNGTLWYKDVGALLANGKSSTALNNAKLLGNSGSKVKFTNVRLYPANENPSCEWTLVLEDGSGEGEYAWYNNNGYWNTTMTIAALEGDGTLYDNQDCSSKIIINSIDDFTGTLHINTKRVGIGGNPSESGGTITIPSGAAATVNAGSAWRGWNNNSTSIAVLGTIKASGTGTATMNFNAVGGTIDLSALATDRTTAFFNGTVMVDNTTTIILPTGTTVSSFPVATTLSGSSMPKIQMTDANGYTITVAATSIDNGSVTGYKDVAGTQIVNGDLYIISTVDATIGVPAAQSYPTVSLNPGGHELTLTGSGLTATTAFNYSYSGNIIVPSAGFLSGKMTGSNAGAVITYTGAMPTGVTWTDSAWNGVLCVQNITSQIGANLTSYGSSNSTIRFSAVKFYVNGTWESSSTLDIGSGGLEISDGNSDTVATIKALTGSGELKISKGSSSGNGLVIKDASAFSGNLNFTVSNRYRVTIGDSGIDATDAKVIIASGKVVNIASAATWTVPGGIENAGTLTVAGTVTGKIVNTGALTVNGSVSGVVSNTGTVSVGSSGVINLGTLRDFTGISAESGASITVEQTRADVGAGAMVITNIGDGYLPATITVKKIDGTTDTVAVSEGVATYGDGTVQIDGEATIYDITFKNNSTDTRDSGTFIYKGPTSGELKYDSAPTFNNGAFDDTTGVYIKHHPYINGAASVFYGLEDFTAVVVGQMSPSNKTEFIHFGSSSGTNPGLLIATTENENEVVIAATSGDSVLDGEGECVKAQIPSAATARHAFVIIKSGMEFAVYADGVKRGVFTVSSDFKLGTSGHSGIQVGSDFGGQIYQGNSGYTNVGNNDAQTGFVNVIRVFDYAISEAQALAVFNEYPYVPQGGLYTRTIDADANLSSTGAWAKDGDDANTYAVPVGATIDDQFYNPSATLTVDASATLNVNATLALETLTVGGSAALTIESDGTHVLSAPTAVINTPVTIKYGAVNLAGSAVQFNANGSLCFDCSDFDISGVYSETRYQLTGLVDQDDAKVTVVVPTAAARTATKNYNSNGYYELVVTPDHEAGSNVYYKSGYFGKGGDQQFSVVLSDGTTSTVVFPGDTVVIDSKSSQDPIYVGELPDNVAAISIARTTKLASGNKDTAMLNGATVTVAAGGALTIYRDWNEIKLGDVVFNGLGVTLDQSTSGNVSGGQDRVLSIVGAVSGSAPLTIVGGVSVASTGSIANAIVLAGAGATLVVQSGAAATVPTSGNADYTVLSSESEGVVTYYLGEKISVDDEEIGYMDGTTAVITNTTETVTIPASATAVAAQPTTNSFVIVASRAQLETPNFLTLTAKYGVSGVQDITSAFMPQIIGGDASAAQVRMTLTGSQTVAVDEEAISVTPTLRAGNSDPAPMAYDAESGNPKFNIKAIPGLYYAVKAYSLPDCEDEDLVEAGSATQATSATVSPVAPAIGAYTVQYYKISVGLSAAEARQ